MVFKVIRGHPTPKLGVFGVIWDQNSKFFKPKQIIYQNEALGPVINIKLFLRSSDPNLSAFGVNFQRLFKKRLVHKLPRAKREAKKKRSVHQLARAKREAKEKSLVDELPRAKRESKKKSQVHKFPRAKREA